MRFKGRKLLEQQVASLINQYGWEAVLDCVLTIVLPSRRKQTQ